MTRTKFNYTSAIQELNDILDKIEKGEPDVDELSSLVNQALKLIGQCKEKLRATEIKLNENFLKSGDTSNTD